MKKLNEYIFTVKMHIIGKFESNKKTPTKNILSFNFNNYF